MTWNAKPVVCFRSVHGCVKKERRRPAAGSSGNKDRSGSYAWVLIAVWMAAAVACGGGTDKGTSPKEAGGPAPESFAFFDVGSATRLTDAVRKGLGDHLGSGAEETRSTLDLSPQRKGLLPERFPELHALNRALNSDMRARVEHNITRISYRYPWREGTPFTLAQVVFSNYTGLPLSIRADMNRSGSAVVERLVERYGPPETAGPESDPENLLIWEKNRDVLLVSRSLNRLGEPVYEIVIYYVNNLESLRDTEAEERRQREQELQKAGKSAF